MAKVERPDMSPPRLIAGEKETLVGFLDYLRESAAGKLDGISNEEARRPLVASGSSLLGIMKHLVAVETSWFESSFLGVGEPSQPASQELEPAATPENVVAAYRAACSRSNDIIAQAGSLEQRAVRTRRGGELPTLRWILVHIIEETARHAGHLDILREQIDGSVGR